jgi:Zn-dependent peptidase ImmA (M78 family)
LHCPWLQRSLDSFLTLTEPGARPAVAWRERGSDQVIRRIEQRFLTFCEEYARLEELAEGRTTGFALICPTRVSDFDSATAVGEALGSQLGLGSHPAFTLRSVLEERGVKVMVTDAREAGSAASAKGPFGAGILINSRNAPWRINYDIAHELFHLITWDRMPPEEPPVESGEKSLADKFADSFASTLLLPASNVVTEFRARVRENKIGYVDIANMALDFGVSTEAMLYRLVNLRLIAREEAKTAISSGGLREIDSKVRRGKGRAIAGHSARFVALAFKCLLAGKLSRARFAEQMDIRLGDIDGFLFDHGYDPSLGYEGEISTA